MADEYWGQSPETLTVSASPTPTSTVFTVNDATNLLAGQNIQVQVSSAYETKQILSKAGNAITLASALSGAPDVPGSVLNSRQLITRSELNASSYFGAATVSDLGSISISRAPNNLKYHVPAKGGYRYASGSALPSDGELVKDPNAGSGQWLWETDNGNLAGAYLAPLIYDSLPVVTVTVDFASMPTLMGDTVTGLSVPGARVNDLVLVQPITALTNGVRVIGYVTAKNTISLQAFNGTGSTQDPTSNSFQVWTVCPNRIPPLTQIAMQQFEALLNGDYNSTTLQTLLGDALQLTHFYILLACRQYMQQLQDDSTARSAISGSALANAAMESYDGAGW